MLIYGRDPRLKTQARTCFGVGLIIPIKRMRRFLSLPLYDKYNFVELMFCRLRSAMVYRSAFKSFGKQSAIYSPSVIGNPRFIQIGERVLIRKGVRLEAILMDPNNPPEIIIGNDVRLEEDVYIVAVGRIHIQNNVCIGARSALLCAAHPFFDVHNPAKIGDRIGGVNSFIEIGDGSLLGLGSVIHMNVKLGRQVVVGSCSVVKDSFPDNCVVDGHPAAVVLAYDKQEDRWQRPRKKSGI